MSQGRLRQITDSMHDTIYLSQLESDMASTAVFYRLHDVYQSSTVYMTFPSNRTKRYEHSLGTMQLAAEMFYYAVTNAEKNSVDAFIGDVKRQFDDLWKSISKAVGEKHSVYKLEQVSAFVDRLVRQGMQKGIGNSTIPKEKALTHYIPHFDDPEEYFYYVCILEAIRLASLFHDAGHPPFSHIIESTINDIYSEIDRLDKNARNEKQKQFHEIISKFSKKKVKRYIKKKNSGNRVSGTKKTPDLHEVIGLELLETAFVECYKRMLENYEEKYFLYYLTIYEFTFAILEEKSPFWAGIHRIIDGPFDADRLDYILRDTRNSGVNWGGIPYKRIIESARLIKCSEPIKYPYLVAFPQKISEDIDDILLMRYKIFSRINSNHRCVKTAMLLQKSVRSIAEEYLSGSADDAKWCSGIENLWMLLGGIWGSKDISISKWNDSWLITLLQSSLVNLRDLLAEMGKKSDLKKKKELQNIQACLESILLNYTNYHTLIKRGEDLTDIYRDALEELSLDVETMEKHLEQLKCDALSEYTSNFSDIIDKIRPEVRVTDSTVEDLISLLDGIKNGGKPDVPICEVIKVLLNTVPHKERVMQQLYYSLRKASKSTSIEKLENWIKRLKNKDYSLVFEIGLGIQPWEEIRNQISQYSNGSITVEDCLLYNKSVKNGVSSLLPSPTDTLPKECIPLYGNTGTITNYDAQGISDIIQSMQSNCANVHYFIRFSSDCKNPKEEIATLRKLVVKEIATRFANQYNKEFGIKLC